MGDFTCTVCCVEAESLIRWMLAVEPGDRPSLDQVLGHPWLTKSSSSSSTSTSLSSPSSLSSSACSQSTSSMSSTDSNDPGSGHTHLSSTSPDLNHQRCNHLQSSSTVGVGKLSSGLSQLTCTAQSSNHCLLPSQSAVNAIPPNSSATPYSGNAPVRRYYLRSFAKLKSPGSNSTTYQSDSPRSVKQWKVPNATGGNGL